MHAGCCDLLSLQPLACILLHLARLCCPCNLLHACCFTLLGCAAVTSSCMHAAPPCVAGMVPVLGFTLHGCAVTAGSCMQHCKQDEQVGFAGRNQTQGQGPWERGERGRDHGHLFSLQRQAAKACLAVQVWGWCMPLAWLRTSTHCRKLRSAASYCPSAYAVLSQITTATPPNSRDWHNYPFNAPPVPYHQCLASDLSPPPRTALQPVKYHHKSGQHDPLTGEAAKAGVDSFIESHVLAS